MYIVITADHLFNIDYRQLSGEEYSQLAWWRVDLGALYDVYQVVIFNIETSN